RRGNTATTTHFVALADGIASGRIRSGDRVIFAISGSGLTLGTALYTLDDLPDRMAGATGVEPSNGRPTRPARSLTRVAGVRTLAFDIFNGAVGILDACHVAARLIQAKKAATALVVVAEAENNADAFPADLLGIEETASALLIDEAPEGEAGFGSFLFRSFTE